MIESRSREGRVKRALDLAVVLLLAPVLLPLSLVVALLVRRRLGSPVFFRQERAGLDGATFSLVKFRTMSMVSDLPDSERLSPFGIRLRALSLDELPSLVNVLRGELSLVGPRPLPVKYVPRYGPTYSRRLSVPPGVTGWAQVNGRNSLTWKEKFDLDLEYVDRSCLLMDLRVLLLTVVQVVRRVDISAPGEATMTEFTGFE